MKFTDMKLRYKIGVGVITGAAVLGMAGGAFAYFTGANGTGSGQASVGTSSAWQVAETAVSIEKVYPDAAIGGANVITNRYTVSNPGDGSQYLASVTISVAKSDGTEWSSQTDTNKPACTASDFSVGGEAVGTAHVDTTAAGTFTSGQSKTEPVTVEMIDNGLNQDNCQGVTVPLYYVASSS